MTTLSDAIEAFMFHCQFERNLTPKTLKAYRTDADQFLHFAHKSHITRPIDVNRDVLRKYIRLLVEHHKTRTVKRKLAVLHGLFSHLEFEDIIPVSPFRKMRISLRQDVVLPRAIPMRIVRRLFKHLYFEAVRIHHQPKVIRDIAVIEFMFATGVRVSEAAALRAHDVDLKNGTARIMGKGHRERIIPICSKEPLGALREYATTFASQISSSGAFFVNRDSEPLSAQSIRFMLRKRTREARITIHITPHMLRHTVATQLVANGADIRQVQYLLGHGSILTTQIYTHVDAKNCRRRLTLKHPRRGMELRECIA
jgi:integrase/recombinase XerD